MTKKNSKKEDRRIERTRRLLQSAFVSLLFEKEYEAISVQDILDRANVGRSTFYTHFSDKRELFRSGLSALHDEMKEAQRMAGAEAKNSAEAMIGFSLFMFEHVADHRKLYHSLGVRGSEIVRHEIGEMVADVVRIAAPRLQLRKGSEKLPSEVMLHFVASSFLSTLDWWLEQKKPASAREVNDLYRALVLPSLRANL